MDRRKFLQNLAVTTAGIPYLRRNTEAANSGADTQVSARGHGPAAVPSQAPDVRGHTFLVEFKLGSDRWKAYEDLRTPDGVITFLSSQGESEVLPKSAEPSFAESHPPYLGLSLDEIGLAGEDLLANRLLEGGGDPDPVQVKSATPPLGSAHEDSERWRLPWDTFVGTKECFDTMPVFPGGSTRTYHPSQYFPELRGKVAEKRLDGLVGGWMPAVRKVMPISDGVIIEVVLFGDVEARDKFIVQTWHRTSLIENGKITKVVFGHSYPAFPPRRRDPDAAEFYRALLVFANYWKKQLADMARSSLPEPEWTNLSKHAFAKELMVRPGGVYPKYGAVDRDYYGAEYDGFQDVFTSAVYTNLEWGRFETARLIIDNYFSDFVDEQGMINMRGPETAQFGLTLSLLARYYRYTRDAATLRKHGKKIAATAGLLSELHEIAKALPADNPGYGLIHGWSESDSCLMSDPQMWWLPYYANSAFAARGLRDMAVVWPQIQPAHSVLEGKAAGADWLRRSRVLQETVVRAIEKNVRRDMNPPYIGTYPGAKPTFRESLEKEHPSPQGWPHRPYSELLEADVLPSELANVVIDCMRSYGATTLGVVANVGPARKGERAILGFISYGYAQMLLRLDRIEEFLLFLYSHRFHDHTRGSWTAGEVAGIDGSTALFCIPAQQTIPLLVRWMLLLEDSDQERLYLAKGIPRSWLASGKEIGLAEAPTSWGKINYRMRMDGAKKTVHASVKLAPMSAPKEIHLKVRLPEKNILAKVTVNGTAGVLGGRHKDEVIITPNSEREFEVVGELS